jgi:uncharacterized spore protein YtfJ
MVAVADRPAKKGYAMSQLDEILAGTKDALTVRRVYGDPFQEDGVTVIPAAAIRGGGGGGEGEGTDGADKGSGSGGGFGVSARPIGAYRIKDGEVTWIPAADTTRVILFSQVLAIVTVLVVGRVIRSWLVSKK